MKLFQSDILCLPEYSQGGDDDDTYNQRHLPTPS